MTNWSQQKKKQKLMPLICNAQWKLIHNQENIFENENKLIRHDGDTDLFY
jgi:hypothetical protein